MSRTHEIGHGSQTRSLDRAIRVAQEVHEAGQALQVAHLSQRPGGARPRVPETGIEELRQAAELYQGDFLEEVYVKNALVFEEWVLTQRERLHELMLEGLDALVAQYINRAEYNTGISYATRLLELDPWRESAHRQMMILLAQSGQRSAAISQYETCHRILAEELGVEWESIAGDSKKSKVRNLLLYLYRRNRVDELIDLMQASEDTLESSDQ